MKLLRRLLHDESHTAMLEELKVRNGAPPWSEPLMLDDAMEAFLIHQPPGHPNDTHYHRSVEWWVILEGEFEWYFEGDPEPHYVKAPGFMFGPPNRWHHITVVGSGPSTRIAIRHRGEFHRYDRAGCGPAGSPGQWRLDNRR